jgi:O-antigen ligase
MLGVIQAAALGVALLVWFSACERRGDRHTVAVVVLALLALEAVAGGDVADLPRGLLRFGVFGLDLRPAEVAVLAGVASRLLATRELRSVTLPAVVWGAFLLWYATAGVVGVVNGAPTNVVLFQGKLLLDLGGALVVGAGLDLGRSGRWLRRNARSIAACMAVVFVFAFTRTTVPLDLPFQRLPAFGRLGSDVLTLLAGVGAALLALGGVQAGRRLPVGVAAVLLCAAPLAGGQRAAFVSAAAAVLTVAVAMAGDTARRRIRVTPTEVGVFLVGFLALSFAALSITVSPTVVSDRVVKTFFEEVEERTAQARVSLYDQATDLIRERPVMGWGLGVQVVVRMEFTGAERNVSAHNLVLDMWMRTGIAGVLLFGAGVTSAVVAGVRRWRDDPDDIAAAMALGLLATVLAVLAKAMVEPALEKYRLGIVLGLAMGALLARRTVAGTTVGGEATADAAVGTTLGAGRDGGWLHGRR